MPIHGGFFNFWEFWQLLAADGGLLRLIAIYGTAIEVWSASNAMEVGRADKAKAWRACTAIEAWGKFGEPLAIVLQFMATYGNLWQLMATYGDL